MAESRIKNKPSGGWTHILNSVAQDRRLSLDTRGLFLMMKSFPADWEFNIPGLATMGACGKDKVRRMLGELEQAGYLLREQSHDESGRFGGNTYVLQDHPPLSGKLDDGEAEKNTVVELDDDGVTRQRETTSSANPTQTKEYIETKEEVNNPPLPPSGGRRRRAQKAVPEWEPERFERFWAAYPRDEGRAKAVEQWDALPKDAALMKRHGNDPKALLDEIAQGLKRHLVCEEWQRSFGIPHAFRWLRDRCWTEKQKAPAPVPAQQAQEVSYGWR